MAFSDDTKRDIVLIISSMLFVLFLTGIGVESNGGNDETIVIS